MSVVFINPIRVSHKRFPAESITPRITIYLNFIPFISHEYPMPRYNIILSDKFDMCEFISELMTMILSLNALTHLTIVNIMPIHNKTIKSILNFFLQIYFVTLFIPNFLIRLSNLLNISHHHSQFSNTLIKDYMHN